MTEKILISIVINKESKFAKKLPKDLPLPDIRKVLGDKLPSNSIFTLPDGSEIDIKEENDFVLSEILKGDKVFIKCKEVSIKKNKPMDLVSISQNVSIFIHDSKVSIIVGNSICSVSKRFTGNFMFAWVPAIYDVIHLIVCLILVISISVRICIDDCI